MDKRITRYNPTSSMSVVNLVLDRFPANAELTVLTDLLKEYVRKKAGDYPRLRLRTEAVYLRQEAPVLQVRLRHEYREERVYDELIRAVDDRMRAFVPSSCVRQVSVLITPEEAWQ